MQSGKAGERFGAAVCGAFRPSAGIPSCSGGNAGPDSVPDSVAVERISGFLYDIESRLVYVVAVRPRANHLQRLPLRALHRLHGSAQILGITALQQLCAPFEAKRPDSLTPASCLEVVQHITGVMREIDGEINALIGR